EVSQLATSSKVASATQAATATYATGGKLIISVGDKDHELVIADGASLTDIRDAINERLSGGVGITANIITDGQGGSRLVLASETTGAGTDISVTGENDLARLNIDGGVANGAASVTTG